MSGQIRFSVDPKLHYSADPEQRRTYGLTLEAPWEDSGRLLINFPEHLEYNPGTKGIARHHDDRPNVWQITEDGTRADYQVESLSEPGVFIKAAGRAAGEQAFFTMTLTNTTSSARRSIRPMLCHDYSGLAGFSPANSDNFSRTYVLVDGQLRSLEELAVQRPEAKARMAQVGGCPDHHNWWAEEMGGLLETPLDIALTAVTGSDRRKLVLFWNPGKNLLSNKAIPCIHADPYFGDLQPKSTLVAHGVLVFTRRPLAALAAEFAEQATRPWQHSPR